MNRRKFLSSIVFSACSMPFIKIKSQETKNIESNEYLDFRHERLFTPNEIRESGFVFVSNPTFIHDYSNPNKPIISSYVRWNKNDPRFPLSDENYKPMITRSIMFVPYFIKDYDIDSGTKRGIHSVYDYNIKKEIYKPMIVDFMKRQKLHYVYEILLGDSPQIWDDKYIDNIGKFHNYMFPVFIRGNRLPMPI